LPRKINSFPLIQREPTFTTTGEVLLVRRDFDRIVFLAPLRRRQDPPLTFSKPFNIANIAARAALSGKVSFNEYVDYNNSPVLAATRTIRETPWGLVVKVDTTEALSSWRKDEQWTVLALVGLMLGLGAATFAWSRHRRLHHIQVFNKELEERVLTRTAELTAANKELESFAYSVSHDLRAPLRGIDGWSLALIEDYGDQLDATAKEYLATIRAETQLMGELIDTMLDLSALIRTQIRNETVNLSELSCSIFLAQEKRMPDRHVEFVVQPDMVAEGDPNQLRVVLQNLFENAWKFTGKLEHARIEFGKVEVNKASAFFVRDNGAGFDMAYVNRLFKPFNRLHRRDEFPGLGVGLSTVKRIIQKHGGTIWAEGAPGHGATFFFTLHANAGAANG
jgi:signal transduction histidine kinase